MKRQRMFARRTGKVLAASRTALAGVFILAVWLDPSQPERSQTGVYLALSIYLAGSLAMVAIAWKSWWFEFRLAPLVHAIDVAAFVAAVYFAEAVHSEFASPFMALTAFLLISATLRWGWLAVVTTSIALVTLNVVVGTGLFSSAFPIEPYRYGRRLMYLGVLSMMMVWLSGEQRTARTAPMPKTPGNAGERRTAVLIDVLAFARTTLQAKGAVIAAPRSEEPWMDLLRDTGNAVIEERLGPDVLEGSFGEPNRAELFNLPRARRIVSRPSSFPIALSGAFAAPLAQHCGVEEALLITFETAAGPGQLMVWGITDMCIDDFPAVEAMARHLGTELDREDMAELAKAASVASLRDSLARDLHDSVAQFLAGTLFRLEALSRWIAEGRDPSGEIANLKSALRREQGELRETISRLRRGEEGDRRIDLVDEIEALLDELSQHWRIAVQLDSKVRPLPVSIGLAYELRQVLREAIANAARHGNCRLVVVTVTSEDTQLKLSIADDGGGFPDEAPRRRPRSISERLEALGGTLNICDNAPGALLEIALPTRNAA